MLPYLCWWKLLLRLVILEVHRRGLSIGGGRTIGSLGRPGPPCLVDLLKR